MELKFLNKNFLIISDMANLNIKPLLQESIIEALESTILDKEELIQRAGYIVKGKLVKIFYARDRRSFKIPRDMILEEIEKLEKEDIIKNIRGKYSLSRG